MIHLNTDLGVSEFPSIGVGEVRVYHPRTLDRSRFKNYLDQDDNISLKIRRKIQERYVIAVRSKHPKRVRVATAHHAVVTHEPTLFDELLTLGALEQRVQFDQNGVGRALLASCYGQTYANITIRKESEAMGKVQYSPRYRNARALWKKIEQKQRIQRKKGLKKNADVAVGACFGILIPGASNIIYCPKVCPEFAPDTKRDKFRFSFYDLCNIVFGYIPKAHEKETPLPGLIIIAGGTGSGKSEITRGLIHFFLTKLISSRESEEEKRPHLLTIENPIEKYLFTYAANDVLYEHYSKNVKGDCLLPEHTQECFGIDYTPRQMPEDTPSLEQALMRDALRQTPDLVYVGEIREPHEFKTVLDFAETGHAVITTMHAGSLREAMQRIFAGSGAETPAQRGAIASRINAVIHLERMTSKLIIGASSPAGVTLPAMWFKTNSAIANLVADGLSSLSPRRNLNRPASTANAAVSDLVSAYCLGRAFFLERLESELGTTGIRNEASYSELLKEAVSRDMDIAFIPGK